MKKLDPCQKKFHVNLPKPFKPVKAIITKPTQCPKCGSEDYIEIDSEGDGTKPESTFFLCNDCGHSSDPE